MLVGSTRQSGNITNQGQCLGGTCINSVVDGKGSRVGVVVDRAASGEAVCTIVEVQSIPVASLADTSTGDNEVGNGDIAISGREVEGSEFHTGSGLRQGGGGGGHVVQRHFQGSLSVWRSNSLAVCGAAGVGFPSAANVISANGRGVRSGHALDRVLSINDQFRDLCAVQPIAGAELVREVAFCILVSVQNGLVVGSHDIVVVPGALVHIGEHGLWGQGRRNAERIHNDLGSGIAEEVIARTEFTSEVSLGIGVAGEDPELNCRFDIIVVGRALRNIIESWGSRSSVIGQAIDGGDDHFGHLGAIHFSGGVEGVTSFDNAIIHQLLHIVVVPRIRGYVLESLSERNTNVADQKGGNGSSREHSFKALKHVY